MIVKVFRSYESVKTNRGTEINITGWLARLVAVKLFRYSVLH